MSVSYVFYQLYRKARSFDELAIYFCTNCFIVEIIVTNLIYQEDAGAQHIPYMFNNDNQDSEVDKTMEFLDNNTPTLIKGLVEEFMDPTGQGRIIVVCYTDASY